MNDAELRLWKALPETKAVFSRLREVQSGLQADAIELGDVPDSLQQLAMLKGRYYGIEEVLNIEADEDTED